MTLGDRYSSGLATLITCALAIGLGIVLLELSVALHLRSINTVTQEALGWACFAGALVLVSVPSWMLLRASVVKAIDPAWSCLILLASIPAGFAVAALSKSDVAGAASALAIASVAYSTNVAGFIGARRARKDVAPAAYAICGGFAFAIVGLVTWAILFFE